MLSKDDKCKCGGELMDIKSPVVGYKVICMKCGISGQSTTSIEIAAVKQFKNKGGK